MNQIDYSIPDSNPNTCDIEGKIKTYFYEYKNNLVSLDKDCKTDFNDLNYDNTNPNSDGIVYSNEQKLFLNVYRCDFQGFRF